jgi:spore photoproduct lyase
MYRSANHVVFVNFEDYLDAMDKKRSKEKQTWFFSGYDGDSLALEPVTGFAEAMLPFFAERPDAWLELRTKSTQVQVMLETRPLANCVTAFSFTPDAVAHALEHRVPSVDKRIAAMEKLADAGWPLGLRFDPVIYHQDYQDNYSELFRRIFARLPAASIHSVSLGPFRLPRNFYSRMVKLYPQEPLFAGALAERANKLISYAPGIEHEMLDFCSEELLKYVDDSRLFPCLPDHVSG